LRSGAPTGRRAFLPFALGNQAPSSFKKFADFCANLIGVLTPGPRLAALTGNRIVYRDGLPIAILSGGKVEQLADLDGTVQRDAQDQLLRSSAPPLLADLH
jgi:hypothetical protein